MTHQYHTFTEYLNDFRPSFYAAAELYKHHSVKLVERNDTERRMIAFDARPDITKLTRRAMFILMTPKCQPDWIELYLTIQLAGEGPKIFNPTEEQFVLLEQMTLNIVAEDYVQPFNTLAIELPKDYVAKKRVILPQAGQEYCFDVLPEEHQPIAVIINHTKEFNMINTSVMWDSGLSTKMAMVMTPGQTLESYLDEVEGMHSYAGSLESSKEETMVQLACVRSALNYCLLLDEVGTRKVGPPNPSYYRRLQERREKHKRDQEAVKAISQELRMIPIKYELNQEVVLHRTVTSHSELPPGHTGRVMPAHHRSGFYKQQPYGPKNSLRKRIRIPPVFVNAHLFLGNMIDARATYRKKD